MPRKLVLTLIAVAAVAGGVATRFWLFGNVDGPDALTLVFADLEGRPFRLSDRSARVLAVNFWASWCAPCWEEMPELDRLQRELEPRGLRIVGLALDERDAVEAFLRQHPVGYPVLLADERGYAFAARVGNRNGILPYTAIFVDGRWLRSIAGPIARTDFLALVEPLLDSPR
ncbi:MAG TPA: TlpA disulfide reductase family protein [Methylococcus sp.]|nr:TlpA disulfide reductase family protein [Methylococcus sp.]